MNGRLLGPKLNLGHAQQRLERAWLRAPPALDHARGSVSQPRTVRDGMRRRPCMPESPSVQPRRTPSGPSVWSLLDGWFPGIGA